MTQSRAIALVAASLILAGGCRNVKTRNLSAERAIRASWFEQFPEGATRQIRFENETGYLDSLGLRERNEQVRDWMFASLAAAYGRSAEETASAVGALRIRRVEDPLSLTQQRGPVRWGALGNGDIVALVPAEDQLTRQRRVGALLDSIRFERGSLSGKIHVFEYSIDTDLPVGHLNRLPSADIAGYYKPEAGYYTATVASADDLKAFLDQADDLIEAKVEGDHVVLAGRAGLLHDSGARIGLEHVAEIYQADARWRVPETRINSLVKDFNARYGHFSGTPEEVARISAEADRKKALIEKLRQDEKNRPDKRTSCGFSLDTKPDLSNDPVYQEARYDCDLSGTESGMILFYGDLTSKLWALNINHEFPWAISDFVPAIAVSLSGRDEARVNASPWTRIWFGPRPDRFHHTATTLRFAPVATRVFAKSFTRPGLPETAPNPVTGKFVEWWNAHYDEISRWEPEYGRLNELQKWSVIATWLEENDQAPAALDFLDRQPVKRNLWFPDWARRQGTRLAFGGWDSVGFERRGSRGSTESLAVLSSDTVTEGNSQRKIVGGVSLATPDDLDPKKNPPATAPKIVVRRVTGGAEAQSPEGTTRFVASKDKATVANGQGRAEERLEITSDEKAISVKVFLDHSRARSALVSEARNGMVADATLANAVVDAVIRKGDAIFLHVPGTKGFSRFDTSRTLVAGKSVSLAGPVDLGRIMAPGETLVVKRGGVSQHGFQAEIRKETVPPAGIHSELTVGGRHVPVVDQQGELHLARDSIPPDLLTDPDGLRLLMSSAGAPSPIGVSIPLPDPEPGRNGSGDGNVMGSSQLNSARLLPVGAPLTGQYLLRIARIVESGRSAGGGPVYYEVRSLAESDWDPMRAGVSATSARSDYGTTIGVTLPTEVRTFPWAIQSGGRTYVRVGDPHPSEPYDGRVTIAYLRTR